MNKILFKEILIMSAKGTITLFLVLGIAGCAIFYSIRHGGDRKDAVALRDAVALVETKA